MIDASAQLPAGLELPAFTVVEAEVRIQPGLKIGPFCHLQRGAQVGADVEIGSHVVIGEGAVLEDGVRLGSHTVIHPHTRVGAGSLVGDHTILGKLPSTASTSTLKAAGELPPLIMGPGCTVGALAVIYAGTVLAEEVFVADLASIRERCRLDRRVIVGRGVTVENDVTIGEATKLQAEVYITAFNYLARTEERFKHRKGCVLRSGCRIGGAAVLLPGVEVGEEAVVGAGSVVTRAVPPMKVAYGVPARVVRPTPPEQLLSAQKKS